MESPELQQIFFATIKSSIPAHMSMVDEVADVLKLSYDSVYRRLRGEKPISLVELKTLCDHFHISLDQVLQINSDAVVFQAPDINNGPVNFLNYLKGIHNQFLYFNSFTNKQMLYLCKDLPIWHFYTYPEIAAFKTFCWIKTIINDPDYHNKKFSLTEFPFDDCYKIGRQIIAEYCTLPSIELWNFESLTSSISQIQYYKEAGLFLKESDYQIVLDSLSKMLDHLQHQAEVGKKFIPFATELNFKEPYYLYVNEVVLGNNTIMVELDGKHHTFINYNVFGYLMTKDLRFTSKAICSFQNLLSRSTIISGTGEKYRNKFFSSLHERIVALQ